MPAVLREQVRHLPSQNTGIDIPIRPSAISSGSQILPRSTAAATPMAMPTTTQRTAAPRTSESVTGVARAICGTTSTPRLENDWRSRETTSASIIFRYCTGSD